HRIACRLLVSTGNRSGLGLNGERGGVVVVARHSPAKSRRAIDRADFVDVLAIEKIECVDTEVQLQTLDDLNLPRQAQVPSIKGVADIGVATNRGFAIRDVRACAAEPSNAIRAQACDVSEDVLSYK